LLSIFILAVASLLVLNIWLYFQQSGMLFYPYKALDATPIDWGLPYEDVLLTTQDDKQLHGWYLPVKGSRQVLLFFHGNAGNISHRGESLAIFHQLGLNVLIIDYRGYGRSQGRPSELGLYRDAEAAWHYLQEQRGFQPGDIIIFGRSLGGAVATQLASRVQPRALILESTFSSVREMAHLMMPWLSRLFYLRYDFDTAEVISRVRAPLLVMHSPQDEIIPYTMGQQVFNAAREPKTFFRLQGGHNDGFLLTQPEYGWALEGFLKHL
jgi:fermentation-respiration switch protein FrsA (DUF1100 family)